MKKPWNSPKTSMYGDGKYLSHWNDVIAGIIFLCRMRTDEFEPFNLIRHNGLEAANQARGSYPNLSPHLKEV
jgi:hypothetical protein